MGQAKLENKKIGILGGSFDPAHKGHVQISKVAKKNHNLNQVIWAVTEKNPFKKNKSDNLEKRINYAKKINEKNRFIKVKCFEKIINSNRTVDLIKYLKKKFQDTEIFFLMGADNLINFHKWKDYKIITKLCIILVFDRTGYKSKALTSKSYIKYNKKHIKFIKFNKVNISSSQLRKI